VRIGLLTSGGDAPGMNACIRAVVRTALPRGHQVIGIRRGYAGLLQETFFFSLTLKDFQMDMRSVSNIIQRGGTILHTSRSERFETQEGLQAAADILRRHAIDALVVIGGDGTFRGCVALARHWDGQIIGCPGTIDNDLRGTDTTIGFTSAVSTAAEAVDKIRDTADATERLFLVEVMGRESGQIALYSALASGADGVLIPEVSSTIEDIMRRLEAERGLGKTSWIVIVAEGAIAGGVHRAREQIAELRAPCESRVGVLGHLQRGGSPAVQDRILASRLGAGAVDALLEGHSGKMVGQVQDEIVLTPFEQTWALPKAIPSRLVTLLTELAR
jgi:6-phosphofructokinase 1